MPTLNIKWLCEIAQVSRSGYYAWLKHEEKRNEREKQDRVGFERILEAYQHRGYAIHMRLLQTGIVMNRKKIQRLMNKYHLICLIRKPNPYKQMAKVKKENVTKPNHLNRQFKAHGPKTVLLTDIHICSLEEAKKPIW